MLELRTAVPLVAALVSTLACSGADSGESTGASEQPGDSARHQGDHGSGEAGTGNDGSSGSGGIPEPGTGGMGGMPEPGVLTFNAEFMHPECYTLEVDHEVWNVRDESGNDVPFNEYECQWQFDDGGTSSQCNGQYVFAESGVREATVTVRHTVTGAEGTTLVRGPVFEPHVVTVTASAPDCGLSIVWSSAVSTGGERRTTITPADNVLTPPQEYATGGGGIVSVSEPGEYTVEVVAEDERPIPICSTRGSATVTVKACDGEEPEPGAMAVINGGLIDEFCDRRVRLQAWAYDAVGHELKDIACRWQFGDGRVTEQCAEVISYEGSGDSVRFAELTVTDRRNGAQLDKFVFGNVADPLQQPTIEAVAPACGLYADYSLGEAFAVASIEVTNGQESFTVVAFGDGRVQLPSAGAWQLRRRVDSFPDGCSAEAVAEVTVVSCDDVCPEHGAVPADHAH